MVRSFRVFNRIGSEPWLWNSWATLYPVPPSKTEVRDLALIIQLLLQDECRITKFSFEC
jgi:hypothetical protein